MRVVPSRVREARLRRMLTQAELAGMAGMTESTINRIEAGLQSPRISTVRRLASVLQVPAEELIEWGDVELDDAPKGKAVSGVGRR